MSQENPFRDESLPYDNQDDIEFSNQPTFGSAGEIILPPNQTRGMLGHVAVLSWLMIVQGVFELLLGIAFIALAIIMPQRLATQMQNNPAVQDQAQPFSPEQLQLIIVGVYGAMGAILIVIGLLSIYGGIRMRRFRGYLLCIVSVCAGFFTLFGGCYCFPTALGVGIYGLIVLLNDPVKCAFEIAKHGYSAAQIKEAFADLPKTNL